MSGGTLLVATAGGHIDELYELVGRRDEPETDRTWVTSRTPQTESLLDGQDVVWARSVGSRQGMAMLRSVPQVWSTMRSKNPARVISTGAAMSVPYLLLARLLRVECTYVESATRLAAPSLTGRIAERIPGVRLRTQSTGWQRRRWQLVDSVFDGFAALERGEDGFSSILVTVGTERFPFSRALGAIAAEVASGVEVSWQTGHTHVSRPLSGSHRPWWPASALSEAARAADLVVTHAGVGSILMALRAGRCPVLIPRRADLGEHVDDHQTELARQLQDRGLAVVAEPGEPLGPLFEKAARYAIRRRGPTRQEAR